MVKFFKIVIMVRVLFFLVIKGWIVLFIEIFKLVKVLFEVEGNLKWIVEESD